MYYIRLDDACEYMDREKWDSIEEMLDYNGIKPLVGIIPLCRDENIIRKYDRDCDFWLHAKRWQDKGWIIGLHGYTHVYDSREKGIHPINEKSEFAGHTVEEQISRIRAGFELLRSHGIVPTVFFAPSHTFDKNTLLALKECTNIRIVSDTIANRPYCRDGITFIPQQAGHVRFLPLNCVTFCYHPNTMNQFELSILSKFIKKNRNKICNYDAHITERKPDVIDWILAKLYYLTRLIRKIWRGTHG